MGCNLKKTLNSADESCSTQLDSLANEEIPCLHETPEFIAMFTEACHTFLSVDKRTKSTSLRSYLRSFFLYYPLVYA
jgi:hypothetical protein